MTSDAVGFVIIGRNEGERLIRCLLSINADAHRRTSNHFHRIAWQPEAPFTQRYLDGVAYPLRTLR